MDNTDQESSSSSPVNVKLKEGINLDDLIAGNPTTFEVNFDNLLDKEQEEDLYYKPEDIAAYLDELDIQDEDVFQAGQSFQCVEEKSTNLIENGKVKKRILRKGYGDTLPDLCQVTIHYNAYIEFQDEPFDSTYARKRPYTFRLNNGEVILGLDMAVQSMKINEKSQFLVHPDYAYGRRGCLERIPENATILYEIELKNFLDTGATITYDNLDNESKNKFQEVYKLAHALCAKGNDLFSKRSYKAAVKEYNTAVSKLEYCNIPNYEQQGKQQELLLRLYSNIVVTYTKMAEPRKACKNANIIYNMCKGTSLKVPTKVYFNNARSLIMLAEYDWAFKRLKDAQRVEPQNPEIYKEFKKLEDLKREAYNREVTLAKAIFKNNEINQELNDNANVMGDFKQSLKEFCEDFKNSVGVLQCKLPEGLTEEEIKYAQEEVKNYGFEVKSIGKFYHLIKTSDLPTSL
ncbi:inactive peptidyl-prolyl cis-trans isomerase FKBP6 [Agrilus planipennis]|uniref:peptidylprolyl isomerase n=1 Tax=Agrilus planipennis TaxID=224129 RepID=A0A1W4XBG3_AGRPL|nr:inactive peptidyl-prolyl cis-trans isomerase FKBP6 [Agrilus planipennis]